TDSYIVTLFSTDTIDWSAIKEVESSLSTSEIKYFNISMPNSLEDIYELYGSLDYLIGGRMHSMIIAQKYLLPYIGVIWQSKVKGFGMVVESYEKLFDLKEFENSEQMFSIINSDINNIQKIKIEMRNKNKELEKIIEKSKI
ncbi:hypothetical protein, partial [Bacillus sp. JJ1764]|uniref:hypothetical protein n=1 Tax=Bacillus sp. JJ1764 TaxID=3122964 RepID=UPI002FFDFE02